MHAEYVGILTLSGVCLWERLLSDKKPDLSALAAHALLDHNLVEGRWEHDGQGFDWLVDSSHGLFFVVARPRVESSSLTGWLSALRDVYLTAGAANVLRGQLVGVESWRNHGARLDRALATALNVEEAETGAQTLAKTTSTPYSAAVPASKNARTWNEQPTVSDAVVSSLDFSDNAAAPKTDGSMPSRGLASLNKSQNGMMTLSELEATDTVGETRIGALFARFGAATGISAQKLNDADLAPALTAVQDVLMSKNVAREVAADICQAVGAELKGKKVAAFAGGVRAEVQRAMESHLTVLLTPKASNDVLAEAMRKRRLTTNALPYVLAFVGVNGVGKSTNLSKMAFWFLQNKLRVLIAACDTFRSGAVEQLRTHVRNLGQLDAHDATRVQLFERGYGKDAASIAKEAIAHASQAGFDVVLIDTAGRMQDNEPLMRALAKLVSVNAPDKVVFVGEALVGNEALDQLRKFDGALKRFSGLGGKSRGVDAILLTKWDTIDDKVGAAVSMTATIGCPLLAVGVGQTYSDLRTLKIKSIVDSLLR